MDVSGIIGVLGFVLAATTFALTRLERRCQLSIYFFVDHGTRFRDEIGAASDDDLLIVQIANTGPRPIVIDRDSIVLLVGHRPLPWHSGDFLGRESLQSPLNPGAKVEVGYFVDGLAKALDAEWDARISIAAELRNLEGRRFRSAGRYTLLFEVNEVHKE